MTEGKKDKLYSQTELANKLKVSQSTITRLIKESGINPAKTEGRKKLYSEDQIKLLQVSSFERKKDEPKHVDSTNLSIFLQDEIKRLHEENDKLVERYTEQLNAKDKQIDDLNERLSESHKLQLGLEQQLKMLPEAHVPPQEPVEGNSTRDTKKAPKTEKKSFWRKIFG